MHKSELGVVITNDVATTTTSVQQEIDRDRQKPSDLILEGLEPVNAFITLM